LALKLCNSSLKGAEGEQKSP